MCVRICVHKCTLIYIGFSCCCCLVRACVRACMYAVFCGFFVVVVFGGNFVVTGFLFVCLFLLLLLSFVVVFE